MCRSTPDAELVFASDQTAVAVARNFAARQLCQGHWADRADDLRLLVSEAVTNAVIHGGEPITVQLRCQDSLGVRIDVLDNGPGIPQPRGGDLLADGGRGLALIEALATSWGVDVRGEQGKAVWFVLGDRAAST